MEEENENEEEHQEEHVEEHAEEHVEEHQEEHQEEQLKQNEQQVEAEHIEENKEKQIEQKVEEKMEQKEEKSEGQFEEENSKENNQEQIEDHLEEKHIEGEAKANIEQPKEELAKENLEKKEEESHKEELITENKDIIPTEKQNIDQEKEIQKEEKKEKVISVSNIVAEAIKSEMKSQEELKGSQDIKKSKLDPSDNYTKTTTSKINLQPSGERNITKTVIHQKIETSSSNENPMVYSFGQGSVKTSKENVQNINLGSNVTFGQNDSMGLRLENNLNSNQIQYESNYTSKSNMISSDLGLSGKYYFTKGYSSHTYSGRSMREPTDTIKGRKRMENDMKAGYEINELNIGPRDSKRK